MHGNFAFTMGVLAAFMTAFYSCRLMFMTFHGRPRASKEVMNHVHESPQVMLIPLYVLAFGAVFSGLAAYEYFVGHHMVEFWGEALKVLRSEEHTSELQSLMRISYAVFCLKKKKKNKAHEYIIYDNKKQSSQTPDSHK